MYSSEFDDAESRRGANKTVCFWMHNFCHILL